MITLLMLLAATAGAPVALPTTAPTLDYPAAKALADADEAAMSKVASTMLRNSQSGVLDRAANACRSDEKPAPFIVVLELDASGKVTRHWRNAETNLAKCMEDKLSRAPFYIPAKAPFYISFEVSFTQ
ncbi:hypothetical protein LVB87_05705 [Lysobacter sp. KIS68-7]|uniref:hypothetical protein n=1 Tax=Lysobacter sp. KIS68-7 TaxID=2904252 RepID=UPI001E418699|nr:hypothetical protein [Lysobacter sp. KIS68-7]UHQ20637.1 hypothetical protein LVB87_05705 [Lysobacter sp. KIS68-7]